MVLAEGLEITARDLDLPREATPDAGAALASLKAAQRRLEVELIVKGVHLHRGKLTRVARDLDVSRTTLYHIESLGNTISNAWCVPLIPNQCRYRQHSH